MTAPTDDSKRRVRAVVVQAGSRLFDTSATLDDFERWCVKASVHSPDLVVFPEAYIGGYPKGETFGATMGARTKEGRELFANYASAAVTVPGPETERLGEAARKLGSKVIVGIIERHGRTLYCTAITFDRFGMIIGHHRKLMPTATERIVWGSGDESTIAPMNTDIGTIGTAICWENYMPLYRSFLYSQGVELWCAPTVDARDVWQSTMRHIAVEGRCFVLSACQYLVNGNETLIGGGSVIVAPLGDIIAGPLHETEGLLFAELDLASIQQASLDLDVVGHYARPDIFRLTVKPPE